MLLFKSNHLDERQLLIRGNIFKHGLFLMTFLIFCNSMLDQFYQIKWAEGKWPELTILLLTITVCCVEFIYHDIYPLKENRQKYMIYCLGITGAASIGLCLYEMATENISAAVDGKLTANLLGILYGCMFITIFITYLCKQFHNNRIELED